MTDNDAQLEDEARRDRKDVELRSAFRSSVEEGVARLHRSWPGLLATGLMGGLDVSMGVLAMLVVQTATGSDMLGSLAFSIGFIALALGKSELFTENFMVPVAAVATGNAGLLRLVRLWVGTLITNLVGAWLFAWLIVWGLPQVSDTALELGQRFAEMPTGQAVALGLIGGAAITLMTWMENGAESDFARLVAVIAIGFLLAAGHLNHVIVVAAEIFVALHSGEATFGYGAWARIAVWLVRPPASVQMPLIFSLSTSAMDLAACSSVVSRGWPRLISPATSSQVETTVGVTSPSP